MEKSCYLNQSSSIWVNFPKKTIMEEIGMLGKIQRNVLSSGKNMPQGIELCTDNVCVHVYVQELSW